MDSRVIIVSIFFSRVRLLSFIVVFLFFCSSLRSVCLRSCGSFELRIELFHRGQRITHLVEIYDYHAKDSGSTRWNRDPYTRKSFVSIDVSGTMSQSSSFVLNTVLQNGIGEYNIDSVMISWIIPECNLSVTARFHFHPDKLVVSWRRTTGWTRHHSFNCINKSVPLRNLFHFPFVVIGNRSSQ